jgi:hypothetical protein
MARDPATGLVFKLPVNAAALQARTRQIPRAVVRTVELGCSRWSSTSFLFSSDEACSPLLSADPDSEFTPPRSRRL